jgi:glucokinase
MGSQGVILAADIGGTKSLLALFAGAPGAGDRPLFERRYASGEFPGAPALLERFLAEARAALGATAAPEAACLGIAGPVAGARVQVTNLPWAIDAAELEARFALRRARLLNDFAAAVYGLDALRASDVATLQAGAPRAGAPRLLIGAGTGLGIAYAMHGPGGYEPLASEGGHASFAPADDEQVALWRHLRAALGRVTLEHVLSGAGLARIHEFLGGAAGAAAPGAPADADPAAAIVRAALEGGDPLALRALDLFLACYGAAAGDHALNVMAEGGVYVAGGIAPKVLARLRTGGFLAAFNDKDAFARHTRRMPVHVVLNERLALLGAAHCAARGASDRASPGARAEDRETQPR